MSTPLIVTQLLLKRAEIETRIKSLEDRLGQARADLLHVAATVRLFDPTAIDRPATVYHGTTKDMRRSDVFALCRAASEAAVEPSDTRQLGEAQRGNEAVIRSARNGNCSSRSVLDVVMARGTAATGWA